MDEKGISRLGSCRHLELSPHNTHLFLSQTSDCPKRNGVSSPGQLGDRWKAGLTGQPPHQTYWVTTWSLLSLQGLLHDQLQETELSINLNNPSLPWKHQQSYNHSLCPVPPILHPLPSPSQAGPCPSPLPPSDLLLQGYPCHRPRGSAPVTKVGSFVPGRKAGPPNVF